MDKKTRKALHIMTIVLIAVLGALNYQIFVFPNDFAPSGLNGILTILRHIFGINFGMMYLVLNIPLLIVANHFLKRRYALFTFIYVAVFSLTSILLRNVDLSFITFNGEDSGARIMAAVAAGVFNGLNYSVAIRLGGSTGGMDIVGSLVNYRHPEISLVWLLFGINVGVAVASFFAFGMNYVPVILCIIYSFVTSRIGDFVLKGNEGGIKFEIITEHAEEICQDIFDELHHGATISTVRGVYSGKEKQHIICVINKHQLNEFKNILYKYPDAFAFVSSVDSMIGRFVSVKKRVI